MISMRQIKQLFSAKLEATGNLDDALKKACWVAYKQGLADANKDHSGVKFEPKGVIKK